MIPERVDWPRFAELGGIRSEDEREDFLGKLRRQKSRYNPAGWFVLECRLLDSSRLGKRAVLPYGPDNTYKEPPAGPVSIRGAASDTATAIAVLSAADLPLNYKVATDVPGIRVDEVELPGCGVKVRHGDEVLLSASDVIGPVAGRVAGVLGDCLEIWVKSDGGVEETPPIGIPYTNIESAAIAARHWGDPDAGEESSWEEAKRQRKLF